MSSGYIKDVEKKLNENPFVVVKNPFKKKKNYNLVSIDELKELLSTPRVNKRFCHHDYVFWKFSISPKPHRVCKKCFRKDQYINPIPNYMTIFDYAWYAWSKWVKDKRKYKKNNKFRLKELNSISINM
jgi:hypothetical protein